MRVLLLAVTLVVCAAAADPTLLRMAPPDAKLVAGIDMGRSSASALGQFLLSRIQNDDAGLQNFVAATGFDPRDIREVIVASNGDQTRGHGLVLVRGSFDVAKVIRAAKAKGVTTAQYSGADVITNNQPQAGWVALLDSSTALAGDADSVKAALDRRNGTSQLDARIAAKVIEVGAKYDAWAVSTLPPGYFARHAPDGNVGGAMQSNMLQAIEQTSGGVVLGQTIKIEGEAVTRSDKDALALVDVIKFLAGMVQMNRDRAPEATHFAALLDTLQVAAQGDTVKLALSVPESDVESWMTNPPVKPRRRVRPPAAKPGI